MKRDKNMTIKDAISKAIEGGWEYEGETPRYDDLCDSFYVSDGDGGFNNMSLYQSLLDPLFWQGLVKTIGLPEIVCSYCGKEAKKKGYYYSCESCGLLVEDTYPIRSWLRMMHKLIDHLASGQSVESFFETIK